VTIDLQQAAILVTRPAAQAESLCHLIETHGGQAIRFPTLSIEEYPVSAYDLQQAITSDWLIFTSKNAVDFAVRAFDGKMDRFNVPAFAAVGEATAECLRQAGLVVDCVPANEFNSEGLLAMPEMQSVAGKRCVIVRGLGGREKIAETLRERGAILSYLEVYRRKRPDLDNRALLKRLQQKQLALTTITSEEALHNLLSMLDDFGATALRSLPMVVVSERIRQTALRLGFKTVAISRQATDSAIFETLKMLLSGENSGRSN
jgi:uroporphyrinogen-III synthase